MTSPVRAFMMPRPDANSDAPGGRAASGSAPPVQQSPAVVHLPAKPSGEAPTRGGYTAASSEPVSRFIELEIEARQCGDLDALRYAIVNSARQLADYEQAFLAEPSANGQWSITRASSVVKIDRQAHLTKALDSWLAAPEHAELIARCEPRLANVVSEATQWNLRSKVLTKPYAFWLPIKTRDGRPLAALLALKSENWRPQHSAMLIPLAGAYGHSWEALCPKAPVTVQQLRRYLSRSKIAISAGALALCAAFMPVPMSALAPAEIVASEPRIVAAPIDGVIDDILVPPGHWVEKGTPIVRFVDVKLRNDFEAAKRNKAVADARHFKVLQSAISTQKDMQDLAVAKAEYEVASAELTYAGELLQRTVIKADRSGLLIYSAKSDWIGKPVSIGERLMEIGDPAKTEIKIELPVSDAIALRQGGQVALFLDGDPLHSIHGTVRRTSYRPTLTSDQQLAYKTFASFSDTTARRIGLRGVARISGETVQLWFYLLRRPISSIRQRVGL